jgi:hypothetical protein
MPHAAHAPAADAADHAALIAALDAGDLAGPDLDRARALAASCAGCAELLGDLAVIRATLPALPVSPRRRDYRLTDGDAARLRPTGWRRVVEWLAAPRSSVRPLATGLATLGVVGLLLTAGLPGFAGSAAMAPADNTERVEAPAAGGADQGDEYTMTGPAAAPTGAPAATGAPAPAATAAPAPGETPLPALAATPAPGDAGAGVVGQGEPSPEIAGEGNATAGSPDDAGAKLGEGLAGGDGALPVGLLLSLALLGSGIALFVARALALRRA